MAGVVAPSGGETWGESTRLAAADDSGVEGCFEPLSGVCILLSRFLGVPTPDPPPAAARGVPGCRLESMSSSMKTLACGDAGRSWGESGGRTDGVEKGTGIDAKPGELS
jgi:hypothetical protein